MSILNGPAIGNFKYVYRYYGDVGSEYSITVASYEETLESRAIHCDFDGRTAHTFFIGHENTIDALHRRVGIDQWKDVTDQYIRELRSKAIAQNLSDDDVLPKTEASVLDAIRNAGEAGKRALVGASGIVEDDWLPSIRSLLARGVVKKTGVGKHTKYKAI